MKNRFSILTLIIIAALAFAAGFAVWEFKSLPAKEDGNDSSEEAQPTVNFYDYRKVDLNDLVSVTPENASAVRAKLMKIIFGDARLPDGLPDTVFEIQDTAYNGIGNLKTIEQFEITQNYNIKSIGYIFHPEKGNGRLFIYHQGHDGDFILGKPVIEYFVNKGFTVYAFCMPLLGKNNDPVVTVDKIGTFRLTDKLVRLHEPMKFLDRPISFFAAPVITMINYARAKNFKDITMCGISGGGWTTTLVAALDTRINYSFPVAGTYPMYIKLNSPAKSYGDFEQVYPPLYRNVNYLDMYILGATGKNRFQIQMLNLHDPCCFDGRYFEHYAPFIEKAVRKFKAGSFKVISDTANLVHRVSGFEMEKIYDALTRADKK